MGRHVVINRIVSKPELNGHTGTALIFDDDKGHYSVKLDKTCTSFMIKPCNLFPVEVQTDTERTEAKAESKKNEYHGGGLQLFDSETGELLLWADIPGRQAKKMFKKYKETQLKPYFKPMRTTYVLKFPETREEPYDKTVALKSNGNHDFKVKSFAEARDLYEQAKALIIHHELTALELDLLVAVHSNLAQCTLNLVVERKVGHTRTSDYLESLIQEQAGEEEALHRAVCDCTQALELQPTHKKARFHRAKELLQLGALDTVKTDIDTLEGAERDVMQELLARAVGRAPCPSCLILQLYFNLTICRQKRQKEVGILV